MKWCVLLYFFYTCFVHFLCANETSSEGFTYRYPYNQIHDIFRPTAQDYFLIQNYLATGPKNFSRLGIYVSSVQNFKIIGETERPEFGIEAINDDGSKQKENCVILYASFNKRYPLALKRVLNIIRHSDFRGDVLYRIGGWPNVEGGDLVLAHVPYAFKACFFKEAKRLGYKRCLWLDTAMIPVVSLNTIFDMIQEKGCLAVDVYGVSIKPFVNAKTAAYFGLTVDETASIRSCSAGFLGIDFTNEIGSKVIDLWHKAAYDANAYYSSRPDQNPLSIILYQQGVHDMLSLKRFPHTEIGEHVKPDSLCILDRLSTR